MGILTGYLLYKAGRKREERKLREIIDERCENCGYRYEDHMDVPELLCPDRR